MPREATRTVSAVVATAQGPDAVGPAPSFISATDLAQGDRVFFGPARALRRSLGALAVLAVLSLIGAVAASAANIDVAPEIVLSAIGATFGFSALWLFASLLRRHPARVCYLPAAAISHGGDRFIRELRPYGHVILYCIGRRVGTVRQAGAMLRNRLLLNLRALCADRQTLTIHAAPVLTQLLARSCDVLVVDLSSGPPFDWDLIQPQAARCVFVSAWGQHEGAEAALARLHPSAQCFFYAPDGEIQRRSQFRAAVLAAMRAAQPA